MEFISTVDKLLQLLFKPSAVEDACERIRQCLTARPLL